jgi:hypothetical protein
MPFVVHVHAVLFAVAENLIHQAFISSPLYRLEPDAAAPQAGVSHNCMSAADGALRQGED